MSEAKADYLYRNELRCVCCGGGCLIEAENSLNCTACTQTFPLVKGVPVLINDQNSVFAVADYIDSKGYEGANYGTQAETTSGFRRKYRRTARALTEFSIETSSLDAVAALKLVCKEMENPRVLVIGSGVSRFSENARFTYTDVAFSPGVNIISDAHDLPFVDQSYDMVIAVAVLEHVVDPNRVVAEIHRVLVPNGWVFAVTPFLQPVHMGAYDFTRFSLLGHRRLFRWFMEVSSGMAQGPAAVAASALRSLLLSFSETKNWRRIINLCGAIISVPIKFLDHFVKNSNTALDGAGGFYFFGRKSSDPLPDRDLIRLYRGGFK